MRDALFKSLSLLDVSGQLILATILGFLALGAALTFLIRARYAALERELHRRGDATPSFHSAVLNRIARETLEAFQRNPHDLNTQAIVDTSFHAELRSLLVGERFVRSVTGLLIILGLVGTFYGLSLSIGRLVALISGTSGSATEITESLTKGLTDALAGMSVAFSCSLFGIVAAIVMTLLGVFFNVGDRRTAVMIQIEAYLDNVLLSAVRGAYAGGPGAGAPGGLVHPGQAAGLERALGAFDQSVGRLGQVVHAFEQALGSLASNTRDFREFNLHLKDNIQRMSLSFGDLSDVLQREVGALRARDRS